jgi:Protein of unknown function DUF262
MSVPRKSTKADQEQEPLNQQLGDHRRKVDFDTLDVMTQQLATMVASGSIDVAPAYQRQFRWDSTRRSQLIESLLLGIPVPSLFMATNRDATWELVDGVQRLSTIVQFSGTPEARAVLSLDEPLRLKGLTKLTSFNGKLFSELPPSIQLHFDHRPVKLVTLTDKSDDVVRFDLFERLNTGGITLTDQEIRACIFRGEFNNYLEKCAENDNFRAVVLLTERQRNDGTREEFVLRFFAFLHRYQAFDHSVVDFLNSYMKDAAKAFDYVEGEKVFAKTFQQIRQVLPKGIVRTPTRKLTPVNLFEAVSVGAALALSKKSTLTSSSAQKWLGSEELKRLTTGATNTRPMVTQRIEYCRNKFLGK